MAQKKYRFFPAVFSLYFLIFAVTPILGTAEFTKAYGQACNALNVKLLIADLLGGNKKPDNRIHQANVLLKKKRAVLPSGGPESAPGQGQCLSASAGLSVPDETLHGMEHEYIPQRSRNVQRYHSGLSPPSA